MKNIILTALVALVGIQAQGASSPAATRDWVRHYVATNSATSSGSFNPSSISVAVTNDQGAAETLTVNFEVAENDAFAVFDSTVAGMANGTLFAKTAKDTFTNTGNILCTGFSGAWEQFGTVKTDGVYQYVTNGTSVATNIIYRATNEVWMTRYTATVGQTVYKSTEVRTGVHLFTSSASSSGRFYVRARKITNAQKRDLTATVQARRFSILDLFAPSAFAYTEGEHQVTYEEDVGDKHIVHWEAHLYTDATEAKKITVGSVTITSANGQKMTYELGLTILDIGQGIDFCNLGSIHVATDAEILAAIEAAVGRNRAIQLSRSQEWQQQLAEKLDQADEIVNSLKNTPCPKEGQDESDIPEDEPEPPAEHQCTQFEGTCGHWVCLECHKVYESVDAAHPATHDYQYPTGKSCKRCIYCGVKSNAQDDHGGWYAGQVSGGQHYCMCECGLFKLSHLDVDDVIYYKPGIKPLVCLKVWRCGRCNKVVEGEGLFGQGGGLTVTETTHEETTNGKFESITTNGHNVCRLTYTCAHLDENNQSLGCGALRSENFQHVIGWDNGAISSMGDDANHVVKYPCCNGFTHWSETTSHWSADNPAWCGFFVTTNKPHHWATKVYNYNDPLHPANATAHKRLFVCGSIVTLEGNGATTCGKTIISNEPHVVVSKSYAYKTDAEHEISNKCGICFGTFLATSPAGGREPHEPSGANFFDYLNSTTHTVSNFCTKCQHDYAVGVGVAVHHKQEGVNAYGNLNWQQHVVSNLCADCGGWYFGTIENHTPRSVFATGYAPNGGWNHNVSNICAKCNSPYVERVCDLCTDGTWTLNSTNKGTNGCDTVKCLYCTNTRQVTHRFVPDGDTAHHCANGDGHLWEAHEWSTSDTNICVKCQWNRGTHKREDPESHTETVTCPSCASHPTAFQCWGTYTYGVLTDSHCEKGWDAAGRRCGCIMCARSLVGCCLCTYASIFPGPWDAPTAGSNN